MVRSIRNLSACILLALVALTAVIIVYSGGGEPDLDSPAAGQENPAVRAEKPEAALEDPDVAEESAAVVPEKPKVAQPGPVLLPLNPPYLNAPIENEAATPAIEPAEEEASRDREEAEQTERNVAEGEQPAEEQPAEEPLAEELLALREQPIENEQPAKEQPKWEEPAQGGQAAEDQRAEEESAQGEEPIQQRQPTEEEQPNETADGNLQEEAPETTLPETSTPPEPEPKRQLTQAQAALRDRLRQTVAFHRGQALSASENTATEVMHCCLAFGCNTELYRSGSSGKKVNGITCLCWNYPCAGYEPLGLSQGRVAPRIGYGLQEHPSQLLAVLALSHVKPTYPLRVGEHVRTVADLVEYEKLSCRSGADLSLKLIGLTYYLGDELTWENSLRQQWSIERIIKEELDQPILSAACGGTQRLMGLGCALAQREKRSQPLEGQFARARKLIDQYHAYALKVQNSDGSWSPGFLAARGTSRNQVLQLRSTGHVLEWLAMSLPEERLDDPRVVRSVEYVDRLLAGQRYRRNVRSLSTREIGSVMHALRALVVYDQRLLEPRTPKPSAAGAEKVARRPSSS